MARQTNDGEPTYGNVNDHKDEEEADRLPLHHFPSPAEDQLSSAGDEPPLVRARLSEDGSHAVEETLSPTGSVVSSRTRPE